MDKIFCDLPGKLECTRIECEKTCQFYNKEKGDAELLKAALLLKNNLECDHDGDIYCDGCIFNTGDDFCTFIIHRLPTDWEIEVNHGK